MQRIMMASVGLTCFAVGCLGATIYGPLAVPAARANAPVQKWEQLCVPYEDAFADKDIATAAVVHVNDLNKGWNRVLKDYGAQGWELVALVGNGQRQDILSACFKRPLTRAVR